jgi:hypothetical protein
VGAQLVEVQTWRSVVNPGDRGTNRLTPTDVAYIELAMLLRERRERTDMRRLISLALERGTPADRLETDAICGGKRSELFLDENPLKNLSAAPAGVLTVVSDCVPAERDGPLHR